MKKFIVLFIICSLLTLICSPQTYGGPRWVRLVSSRIDYRRGHRLGTDPPILLSSALLQLSASGLLLSPARL
jgi:hypothetical protein